MDWRDILIDTPGWAMGQVLGALLHLVAIGSILAVSIYAGVMVYRLIRVPVIAHILAISAAAWLLLVLHRAEIWTAATWIKHAELRNSDE